MVSHTFVREQLCDLFNLVKDRRTVSVYYSLWQMCVCRRMVYHLDGNREFQGGGVSMGSKQNIIVEKRLCITKVHRYDQVRFKHSPVVVPLVRRAWRRPSHVFAGGR